MMQGKNENAIEVRPFFVNLAASIVCGLGRLVNCVCLNSLYSLVVYLVYRTKNIPKKKVKSKEG